MIFNKRGTKGGFPLETKASASKNVLGILDICKQH